MKPNNNNFLQLIGNTPHTRLLNTLITGRDFDYSLTDLCKNSEISWTTIHRILPKIQQQKIITQTRQIGKAKLYQINQQNQAIKKLIQLYDTLIKNSTQHIDCQECHANQYTCGCWK